MASGAIARPPIDCAGVNTGRGFMSAAQLLVRGEVIRMAPPSEATAGHGAWRSLVAHLLWEQRVGGSNPSAPTIDSCACIPTARAALYYLLALT